MNNEEERLNALVTINSLERRVKLLTSSRNTWKARALDAEATVLELQTPDEWLSDDEWARRDS